MYLKGLEIQGFKSFADKVDLEFNPGITVVVGPNGSGKSNIVDAIRWVLGEQSAKTLRGMRMDDIIFSGSDGRRPVGLAQVSLTIDNSRGIFPLDFNEVTVTRRLYRSGESEYLINKVPCRMKDIHELFMDTGVGKEGFSVIGQGKIDEILSLKAEERRNLIEEAAGIVKYRYRKKEAQRKLDDTEQSMLRINDIISELREQVGPLEEQANKARQYYSWKEEADQWEISLTLHSIRENREKKDRVQENLSQLDDQLTILTTSSHQLKSNLETAKFELQGLEQDISVLQERFYATSRDLEKHQHQIEMGKEKKAGLYSQIQRLKNSCQDLEKGEKDLKQQLEKYLQETKEMEAQHIHLTEVIAGLTTSLNSTREQVLADSSLVEEKKNTLFDILQEKAKINNEIIRLKNEATTLVKRKENLANKLMETNRLIAEEEEKLAQKDAEGSKLVSKKNTVEEDIITANKALEESLLRQQQIKKNLDKQNENYQETKSHLNILQGMEESGEGYQKGVKAILEAKKANQLFDKGILGTVADIIKVPSHLETAIETALGGSLQHLITENDSIAQKAIDFLKGTKQGRATFLPLNTITYRENFQDLQGEFVLGRASELVSYDGKYRKAVEFLLGRIWVIRDLKQGVYLGKKTGFNVRMVTLEGELITPGGALTGGSFTKNKTGLLTRKRLISDLTEKILTIENSLKETRENLQKEESNYNKTAAELSETKDILYHLTLKISQNEGEKAQIAKEINRLKTDGEVIIYEQGEVEEHQILAQEEIRTLLGHLEQLNNNHSQIEMTIEEVESSKKELAALQEELLENLNKEKITIATLEQGRRNSQQRYEEINDRLNNILEEKEKLLTEQQDLEKEIFEIDQSVLDWQQKIKEDYLKLEGVENNLTECKDRKELYQEDIVRLEKEIKEKVAIIEEHRMERHQQELVLAKVKVELENNEIKLEQQFECTYEQAQQREREVTNKKSVVKRINELRTLIGELGLVNFAAINEFERVKQRLDFLEKQIKDLEEAKSSLTKVIKEMDQIMVKRFRETFELVNNGFTKVFGQLFGGGKASLELTDSDNLLETGIEIIAQPPGKKPQSLSLLSGGERAMTAIALLLAILEIKPSPFCVLDEIEAALDEANVLKFAQYLKSFNGNTQFIIISHRKGTMEIGDFLYGVTIEANGVSKLISVKLSEAI